MEPKYVEVKPIYKKTTLNYPYVELKKDLRKRNILYFHLHLNSFTDVKLSLKNDRSVIRQILNPNHRTPVEIYSYHIKRDSYDFACIERLSYHGSKVLYQNLSTVYEIPFTEGNRQDLQSYDYQLEQYYNEGTCCVLY